VHFFCYEAYAFCVFQKATHKHRFRPLLSDFLKSSFEGAEEAEGPQHAKFNWLVLCQIKIEAKKQD